ncbi:Two-component system sensor histidine kinase [hydrothermal vent metagenome]|uniref:histidine kinase n=1 Tax=hydrothermal vent metagenome TaxID=652676 RepID=A0A3B1D1L9_9ZZZZ
MKERKIKILIILMTIAVLGLIIVQVYWSIKTIATEEIRFDAKVNETMLNIVNKIDKDKTADIVVKKIKGGKDKLVWVEKDEQTADSDDVVFFSSSYSYDDDDTNADNIEVTVKVSPDGKSNTKVVKRIIKHDLDGERKVTTRKTKIDTIIINKQKLVTEVIEEMTSLEDEDDLAEQLSESYLDSMITKEFSNNGIDAKFDFGVMDKNLNRFIIIKTGADKEQLQKSKFNISMSPHNIFAQPFNLLIYIPNKFGFLLKSVWIMLILSLLFVGIIVAVYIKTLKMFLDQKKITEVKNDLINNITHEFKTPISSIALATEALQEPQLRDQQGSVEKYSGIIAEENERLTKLVENLLNTAAFERSEIELKRETVNVSKLLNSIVEKAGSVYENINISIQDTTLGQAEIKADVFHLSNILNNLIDNAVKYSKGKIVISIEIRKAVNGIDISVSDRGIGISKTDQQKIFETFYRVPTGNVHNVKGNGIGLSYVKTLVEAHNGWIKVSSKLGEGSTFTIYLPNE